MKRTRRPKAQNQSRWPETRLSCPEEGVRNIKVKNLADNSELILTHLRKRGIRQFFWHPNSEAIFFLEDQGGNENFHLFQADVKTRNVTDLTPFNNTKVRIVAVDPANKEFMLLGMNKRNPKFFDVYKLSFSSAQ
ncbi:hypothetical protein [Candidatus Methylacidiphilum infernorum]|uniref:hypothetical protein n=1 Tax=Candidatus Methylacidiphilum infernorum TaxID=511746 RepID=UPI000314B13A|nr:hypothetical protein [Candidatus Methylacidiphilum infernorum]